MALQRFQSSTVPIVRFTEIGSTNAEGLARLARGEALPVWIVADIQSAGRGRRGRPWTSEVGNLFATLVLPNPAPAANLAQLCFVAGLALRDAVLGAAPELAADALKLKWPNDLILDGGKLAGILVEGGADPGGRPCAVVGFGVNCLHHPEDLPYLATSLAAAGSPAAPDRVLEALDIAMAVRLNQWHGGNGFPSIRTEWMRHALAIGDTVMVKVGEREVTGRFESIDTRGAMMLRRRDGIAEIITAGDVLVPKGE
ncbi:biotin--[acetyl-CoA-carboxylase] ligase [Aquabacter spiritensis]|uniref:BirA family biotin operon repressor/biotin-[acetyl-CoA-carboxylase] ligase n=1 Tax=Aquabacter spiritensis TaxID=933073 RepID=A0A4R3LMD9_9HYPH|nr:biotin--[acetyl-CoA-carboxylase] ligase [Aquabacter spiritensis]TCT01533.1 BirA family biotin operon repressor/biotin-[acetyl-CoA-carboxylase] ligase [Aquabacter spiritensis]